MPITKKLLKSKNICRVTFSHPVQDAEHVCVVGDFNNWNPSALPMKKGRREFSASVDLEPGREYQFRYFLNGQQWANDDTADGFADTPFPDAQNSILQTK